MGAGELESEDVVRTELTEIVRYNPRFNAFITIFDGESQPALAAAKAVDRRIRGRRARRGALAGIPHEGGPPPQGGTGGGQLDAMLEDARQARLRLVEPRAPEGLPARNAEAVRIPGAGPGKDA